ncbi:MAG: hypothetical protein ABW019_03285 [Chitinophagaceae bacterium]
MPTLKAGAIVNINAAIKNRIKFITSYPRVKFESDGATGVNVMISFNINNAQIVADDQVDEADLDGINKQAHIKFDSAASRATIARSLECIELTPLGLPGDRGVKVNFEFTLEDGKVGGAGS